MTDRRALLLLVAILLGAAVFVLVTGRGLPDVVASHFDFAGTADGHMGRDAYLAFMTTFVVGLPLVIAVVAHFGGALLRGRLVVLAALLAGFLAYLHWLVVEANAATVAHLSNAALYGGLAVLLIVLVGWSVALRRGSRDGPPS